VKKVYLFLGILLVAALILGSCAQPAPTPTPAPAPAVKEWVPPVPGMKPGEEDLYFKYVWASGMARSIPPPGFEKSNTENFFDALEKATQGRFKVKYAYGGILGSMAELPHLISAGVAEMSSLTGPEPADYTYLSLPTTGWMTLDQATNMKLAEKLYTHPLSTEVLDRMNLVYVGSNCYSPNYLHIRKGVKPIKTVEDLKGLQVGVWSKCAKIWAPEVGMVPVTTTLWDTYEGISKGTFDVTVQSMSGLQRRKYYEVCGQSIKTASGGASPSFTFMNKDAWNRLPQYIKDLWWQLYPAEFNDYYVRSELADFEEGVKKAAEYKMSVFSLPEAEEAKLIAALKMVWEDWEAEILGYPGGKQVKQFLKDQIALREEVTGEPWTLYTP